jgi:hypothetical protein
VDHGEPPPLSLKRFVAQLIVGAIGGFISGMLMLLVVAIIGGNIATNFAFAGNRGDEATGGIGLRIGIVLGTPPVVYAVSRRQDIPGRYLPTLAGSVLAAVVVGGSLLVSPRLRFVDSVVPLTGLIALGATIGYNSTQRFWHVAGYASVVVAFIVVGWGYSVYRQRVVPAVTFTGDLHGGHLMRLSAIGDHGTTAHTASAPPADQVVQQGQVLVTQCVPSPASDTIPHVTVRGQYFKPEESIQIAADYTRADCTSIFLTGQTRAAADGTFTVDLVPDPQLNAPPPP